MKRLIGLLLLLSLPVHASLIDDAWNQFVGPGTRLTQWDGTCLTGCTGQAHMQFSSSNPYVQGNPFAPGSNFFNSYLAVRYTSSIGDFIFAPNDTWSTGDVPVGMAPFAFFFFSPVADGLTELADGSWTAKVELTANGPIVTATGSNGIFAVPEPIPLALLVGAGLLVLVRTARANKAGSVQPA